MWDHTRMAWAIYWIIIGLFTQAHGFSTTVVKEGEDAIIECGLQTTVEEGYLRWETVNNGNPVDLAFDLRDGISNCDDRIVNCTIHANGSIQLESVGKEDGARHYRCLRGDDNGYNYYSDHRLLVLSKESPSISQSPTPATAFKVSRKGIIHSYGEPACEDDADGNLPVVCYPPSGILVDREYETIQCNCTDSDGLMDNVTFPVTKETSSPPLIETRHSESVSSYNMGKKGVLHGYNAPVCEDDVDGNLPVVCYPPSGILVDREYVTIQCNCTDSDGLMDSVTFPVTSLTHRLHPGWTAYSVSIISMMIIIVLLGYCCILHMKLKKFKEKCEHAASEWEKMKLIGKQNYNLVYKIAALKERLNNSNTELTQRNEEVSHLKDQVEQKETQETEMKNKLEEQNEKINTSQTELSEREDEVSHLKKQLEQERQTFKN